MRLLIYVTVGCFFLTNSAEAQAEDSINVMDTTVYLRSNPNSAYLEAISAGTKGLLVEDSSEEFFSTTRSNGPLFLILSLPDSASLRAPTISFQEFSGPGVKEIIEKQNIAPHVWAFLHDPKMLSKMKTAMKNNILFALSESKNCDNSPRAITWGSSNDLAKTWNKKFQTKASYIILTRCSSATTLTHELFHVEQFRGGKTEIGATDLLEEKKKLLQLSESYNLDPAYTINIWQTLIEVPAYLHQLQKINEENDQRAWLYNQSLERVIETDLNTYQNIESPFITREIDSMMMKVSRLPMYLKERGHAECAAAVDELLLRNIIQPGYPAGEGPMGLKHYAAKYLEQKVADDLASAQELERRRKRDREMGK